MVEAEGKERANEGRFHYAQETDDVRGWQEENCRSTEAKMGEGQSEGCLERSSLLFPVRLPPSDLWKAGLL
jgi:hypothetical protein